MVGLFFIGHGIRRPALDAVFIVEVDGEAAKLLFPVAAAQIVDVVPLITVELVADERNAEKELHLGGGHALFELIDHFAGDEIALVNVRTIGLQEVGNVVGGIFPGVRHARTPREICGQEKQGGGCEETLELHGERVLF